MSFKHLISIVVLCVLVTVAGAAQAQLKNSTSPSEPPRPTATGPSSLKSVPPGKQRFEACCSACPAGGCTGCDAYPNVPQLNCGSGLIKAKCQVVDNKATCIRDDG